MVIHTSNLGIWGESSRRIPGSRPARRYSENLPQNKALFSFIFYVKRDLLDGVGYKQRKRKKRDMVAGGGATEKGEKAREGKSKRIREQDHFSF